MSRLAYVDNTPVAPGSVGPKSSGCFVTWNDVPRLCATFAVFCCSLGFGSGIAILGAALPDVAATLDVESTSLGILFSCRGLGVLIGASLSAWLLESKICFSKHMMCCIAVILAGVALILVAFLSSIKGLQVKAFYAPFILQGACFGALDSFSAVAIAEMWGQRQQPWMQMKNMMSGAGAVVAPLLAASYSWQLCFIIISFLGASSIFGVLAENMISYYFVPEADNRILPIPEVDEEGEEMEDGSMSGNKAKFGGPSAAQDADFEKKTPILGQYMALPSDVVPANTMQPCDMMCQTQCMVPYDDSTLIATEHTMLTNSLATIDKKELRETDNWQLLTDEILYNIDYAPPQISFAHTPSHGLDEEDEYHERFPLYQPPGVEHDLPMRILSFATADVAATARKNANFGISLVPSHVRCALVFFSFWQIGLLYSCGGWLSTCVQMSGTNLLSDATAGATWTIDQYATIVPLVFFISQTVCSIISVPLSMIISTTAMMRLSLGLVFVGWLLLILPVFTPGWDFLIAASALGSGLSCLYPLTMTIVNDYGATMDSRSTVAVVMGACIGESIAPAVVGQLIATYGVRSFTFYILVAVVALISAYIFLHLYLRRNLTTVIYKEEFSLLARSRATTLDGAESAGQNSQTVVELVQRMLPSTPAIHPSAIPDSHADIQQSSRSRATSRARSMSKTPAAKKFPRYGSTDT